MEFEIDKIAVGRRLEEWFFKTFKNLKEGSDAMGIASSNLKTQYFSGKSLPGAEIIGKLLKLKCDIYWLLFGEIIYTTTAGEELANTEFILFLQDENEKLKKQLADIQKIIVVTDEPQTYSKVADNKEEYKGETK